MYCTNTHTHRHTLSVLLPDQHHFLSIQQTSRRERRQIQTDRERRKWQKGLWTERGLDTTIFCPTGVDTHGRPNRLRKARRGGGTLHTSGVRERGFVYLCVPTCRLVWDVFGREAIPGLQHLQSPSIQRQALCVSLKPLKMPPRRMGNGW